MEMVPLPFFSPILRKAYIRYAEHEWSYFQMLKKTKIKNKFKDLGFVSHYLTAVRYSLLDRNCRTLPTILD
jgi:hypothetical protein